MVCNSNDGDNNLFTLALASSKLWLIRACGVCTGPVTALAEKEAAIWGGNNGFNAEPTAGGGSEGEGVPPTDVVAAGFGGKAEEALIFDSLIIFPAQIFYYS
jgi:hypothetical protein